MRRNSCLPENWPIACSLGCILSAKDKRDVLSSADLPWVFLAKEREKWHKQSMCFHATISGAILPIWSKTAYDEVMLHCARIGFKP